MNVRVLSCGYLAAAALLTVGAMSAPTANRDFDCAQPLVHLNADGTLRSGSKESLIAALNTGKRIRVGWRLGTPEHVLLHWAEPIFSTVFHGNVYAQIPAIHVQRGVGSTKSIELFGDEAELWHGLIGTDGRLSGRIGAKGKIEGVGVEQAWCGAP